MKLGLRIGLYDHNVDDAFKKVRDLGFDYCQFACWDSSLFTEEVAKDIIKVCKKYEITVTTFWCGWCPPCVWNFSEGPLTIGLVPAEYRHRRMEELMKGSDFAKMIGIENIATHVGFIPENPLSAEYQSLVCALRTVAQHCKKNDQYFMFETGQETPVTLRRTIEDIGLDNLGINLDPANLILYGKGNPIDALGVFGEYVRDIHAKDGCYPTDGINLGEETPIGEGMVDFPRFIEKLKEIGYDGPLTIERETKGEQQIKDIIATKTLLEELI